MNLWQYLDRVGERRANRPPSPPRDIRHLIGFGFLAGYYFMVWQFAQYALPAANLDLIRDAMLTLGPPVGMIVQAMFRSDAKDEQQTRNTQEAFRAIKAVGGQSEKPDVLLDPGETAKARE